MNCGEPFCSLVGKMEWAFCQRSAVCAELYVSEGNGLSGLHCSCLRPASATKVLWFRISSFLSSLYSLPFFIKLQTLKKGVCLPVNS